MHALVLNVKGTLETHYWNKNSKKNDWDVPICTDVKRLQDTWNEEKIKLFYNYPLS